MRMAMRHVCVSLDVVQLAPSRWRRWRAAVITATPGTCHTNLNMHDSDTYGCGLQWDFQSDVVNFVWTVTVVMCAYLGLVGQRGERQNGGEGGRMNSRAWRWAME